MTEPMQAQEAPTNSGQDPALKVMEELQAQSQAKDARILELEAQVNSVNGVQAEVVALKEAQQKSSAEANSLKESLSSALGKYKALVLAHNPDVPEELLQGATLEELDTSLEKAKALVAKVRERVKAEQAQTLVPAGAPPRQGPNLEALSPIEKIKLGLIRR